MIDAFLFDAGSVFLAAWALTLTSLCVVAFGRDLLPSKATLHPADRPVTWLRPQLMDSDLVSEVRSPVLFLQTLEMRKEGSHLKWQLFR
jgi:hypothetical protein